MKPADVTLVVLAKAPIAARVKTRLCPPCTSVQAAALAEAALTDMLRAVAATPVRRRVLALDGAPGPWLSSGFDVIPQRGNGLDERLTAAFADVEGPALLIGMDTPQLAVDLLIEACGRLVSPGVDAVLGPAADGGWWTIGMRCSRRDVFVGIPTSTGRTAMLQLVRLRELGWNVSLLPELTDVDDIDSARHVAKAAPSSLFARRLHELVPA